MTWSNPYSKMIGEVMALTFPPDNKALGPGRESLAVGLLMRARLLLNAQALVSDRILAGATDPLLRAVLEACFTGAWLLADEGALEKYLGHHRMKWRIIAEEQLRKPKEVLPRVRRELEPFLDGRSLELRRRPRFHPSKTRPALVDLITSTPSIAWSAGGLIRTSPRP